MTSTDMIIFVDRRLKVRDFKHVIEDVFGFVFSSESEKGQCIILVGLGRIAGFLQIEGLQKEREAVLECMKGITGFLSTEELREERDKIIDALGSIS